MSENDLDSPGLWDDPLFERFQTPVNSPVAPHQLTLDDEIQFRCHKGIACFNACCSNIDITLTPWDIRCMARRLDLKTWQVMLKYTMPFEMDAHGLPGVKLRPVEKGTACQFMVEEGCSIYEDRPTACRYYALGIMELRRKDSSTLEDVYFMVKEEHCLGHQEERRLTVREYRQEQGVEAYDDLNRGWMDLVVKKKSAGPAVGAPSERSLQLFSMLYDLDAFRLFTQSEGFNRLFDIDPQTRKAIDEDDAELLRFGVRFLRQTLFGEKSIPMREEAVRERYEQRKEVIEQKARELAEKYELRDPQEEGEA
ncbi:MAG TPA: YkgJ family cysteine cluster protein [Thiotrichales bacterium]|nr:YkgJ family cysteine cluster protein [Thiotrichales bacterium]